MHRASVLTVILPTALLGQVGCKGDADCVESRTCASAESVGSDAGDLGSAADDTGSDAGTSGASSSSDAGQDSGNAGGSRDNDDSSDGGQVIPEPGNSDGDAGTTAGEDGEASSGSTNSDSQDDEPGDAGADDPEPDEAGVPEESDAQVPCAGDSVDACGSECAVCTAPDNAQPTCDGDVCGFECVDDFEECDGECISEDACCDDDDCPAMASCNGSRQCVCDSGYHGPECDVFFEGLDYPTVTDNEAIVTALSADGSTVVGHARGSVTPYVAFRWHEGSIESLGIPGGASSTEAYAVNADGSVVVGDVDASATTVAFEWTESGGIDTLPLAELGTFANARGVSGDGSVIVGFGDRDSEDRAVRWDNGAVSTVSSIDPLTFSSISGDGSTIGGQIAPGTPMVRTTSTTSLDLPGGGYDRGEVLALATDGDPRVGFVQQGSTRRAVRWMGTTPLDLGTLGGSSSAGATNGDGSVVVGVSNGEAFICFISDDAHDMRSLTSVLSALGVDLEALDWTLTDAVGISSDGKTIAGNGRRGSLAEGWIARLP